MTMAMSFRSPDQDAYNKVDALFRKGKVIDDYQNISSQNKL